jgi:ankyrin repeat protein
MFPEWTANEVRGDLDRLNVFGNLHKRLSRACSFKTRVHAELLVLEKNADVDSKSNNGRTPLSWAAVNGHEAAVKLLLEKNADVDLKDNEYGQTSLSWAAVNGHEAVVKLLLEKNADVDLKDQSRPGTKIKGSN